MNTQLELLRQSFIFCHITTRTWNLFALFAIGICTGKNNLNIPERGPTCCHLIYHFDICRFFLFVFEKIYKKIRRNVLHFTNFKLSEVIDGIFDNICTMLAQVAVFLQKTCFKVIGHLLSQLIIYSTDKTKLPIANPHPVLQSPGLRHFVTFTN